jgi:hypothetical protein
VPLIISHGYADGAAAGERRKAIRPTRNHEPGTANVPEKGFLAAWPLVCLWRVMR